MIIIVFFRDLEREFNEKQSNVQILEKEVSEGRKRCSELEEELDQVNKDIGDARVSEFVFLFSAFPRQ